MASHFLLGLIKLGRGEPRIEPLEGLPKIPGEEDFSMACPAKGAVYTKLFGVIGKGYLPAQLTFQQMSGTFLNENVFGVVVAHGITSQFIRILLQLKSVVWSFCHLYFREC